MATTNTIKVFGPPGTGKTTRLLDMLEQVLESGVEPEQVAFVSFTNAACDEARERAATRFGYSRKRLPWFRTLHSCAYQLLRVHGDELITSNDDLHPFSEYTGYRFSQFYDRVEGAIESGTTGSALSGDALLAYDHYARHRLEDPVALERWPIDMARVIVERFRGEYRRFREQTGKIDFTDLLELVSNPLPVRYLFIDEAQDLSPLQWNAVQRMLPDDLEQLVVAGDDDQAVFTWAGASPEHFIRYPTQHMHVLDHSWRLPRRIWSVVQGMGATISTRAEKPFTPREEKGRIIRARYLDQVKLDLDAGPYLCLYRSHYRLKEALQWAEQRGIPYRRQVGKSPVEQWGTAIMAWTALERGKAIPAEAASHVYRALRKGEDWMPDGGTRLRGAKGLFTLAELKQSFGLRAYLEGPWYEVFDKLTPATTRYLRNVIKYYGGHLLGKKPVLQFRTVHSSKGMEANGVILITDIGPKVLRFADRYPDAERRVWYVGLSRARQRLWVVGDENPFVEAAMRKAT